MKQYRNAHVPHAAVRSPALRSLKRRLCGPAETCLSVVAQVLSRGLPPTNYKSHHLTWHASQSPRRTEGTGATFTAWENRRSNNAQQSLVSPPPPGHMTPHGLLLVVLCCVVLGSAERHFWWRRRACRRPGHHLPIVVASWRCRRAVRGARADVAAKKKQGVVQGRHRSGVSGWCW